MTGSHVDIIVCPECNTEQRARVAHTVPFYTYLHTCENCGYVIMESDWDVVKGLPKQEREP